MGEAIYTMIAKWKNRKEAEEAKPKVLKFLMRMGETRDLWQEVRMKERDNPAKADNVLRTIYPEVFRLLKIGIVEPDKGLNYLVGQLSSPYDWEFNFGIEDNIIRFSGIVWHFANWGPLANALKEEFGAIETKWWSDEYV